MPNLGLQAGDQYCGRMLAGFDVHSSSFRQLPAHFRTLDATSSAVVNDAISVVFGRGENSLPVRHPSLKPVLSRYLAALVYHYDWLVAKLGANHKIFTMVALCGNFDIVLALFFTRSPTRICQPHTCSS